jgi:hypothetical protein
MRQLPNGRATLGKYDLPSVALLYAACGGLSSLLLHWCFLNGVTFTLLTALLLLGTPRKILAAPLIIALWFVPYFFIYFGRFDSDVTFDTIRVLCIGGFFGGLGVSLAVAIGYRKLRSVLYLPLGGIIGAVAALPFGASLHSCAGIDPKPVARVHLSFAIWQAAVGTYLYTVCAPEKKATQSNAH